MLNRRQRRRAAMQAGQLGRLGDLYRISKPRGRVIMTVANSGSDRHGPGSGYNNPALTIAQHITASLDPTRAAGRVRTIDDFSAEELAALTPPRKEPMTWDRRIRALADTFQATVSPAGGGHLKITLPSGKFTFAASTPSDPRAYLNVRAQLRRLARADAYERGDSPAPIFPPSLPMVAPASAASTPPQTSERPPVNFQPLAPETVRAREEWLRGYLRDAEPIPPKYQLREAFRAKFGVDIASGYYSDAINAELDRRKLHRRHKGWRAAEGDRPLDQPSWEQLEAATAAWARAQPLVPSTTGTQEHFKRLSGGKVLTFSKASTIVAAERARRGASPGPSPAAPAQARSPAPSATTHTATPDTQSEINAAIELLLTAVPNLARLTLTVDDMGAASVEFTTRVVQTVSGTFAITRGKPTPTPGTSTT